MVQTEGMDPDDQDRSALDESEASVAESYLADSVLVVGDAGMASARSLAELGYDVRLAQLGDDESIEIVWRSDERGVTIELEVHSVEHAELVYVAEPVRKFLRVVKVARQIGAGIVWSPFADHDHQHRRIVEGAGLFFVSGVDIVVVARRHLRNAGLQRLEILDALLLALDRWHDVTGVIGDSEDRPHAREGLMNAFDLSEIGANFVLDMNLGRRTKQARLELEAERAQLLAALGLGPSA